MCVNVSTTNVAYVPQWNLLHSVPTFKSGFKKLILTRNSLIFINDSLADPGQISLEIYEYKSDSEVTFPPYNKSEDSFLPSTPLPSACIHLVFIDITTKNKAMYK